MNRNPTPSGWSKVVTGLMLAIMLLGVAGLLDVLFPQIREALIALIRVRSPTSAAWLDGQKWSAGFFIPLVLAAISIWIATKFLSKRLVVRFWHRATQTVHRWVSAVPQPSNCVPLSEIFHNKLKLPEEDHDSKFLELLGRTDELDWLVRQVQVVQAPAAPAVRVLLLWGPQGIGKTHLLYRFATDLIRGQFKGRIRGRWHAWGLNREFDPKALAESLPQVSTLLLWDDISLDDDASHRHLRTLLGECAGRKHPLVVALSGWRPRIANTLTRELALVDAEREVEPLDLATAQRLYAGAADLPVAERGHPLLLRLLSRQAASATNAALPLDLWDSCRRWAGEFAQRLESKFALGPAARQALAVVSSSEASAWPQVQGGFGLTDADHRALEKTGRLRIRQGAVWLEPVRPDLLGWAYALHALAMIPPQDAERWAIHAWNSGFFDTERFLRHAMTHQQQEHVWVRALHAPQLEEAGAALARAKAATNSIYYYGGAQEWVLLDLELSVSQEISQKFQEDIDVQLERLSASVNAINDYGADQRWVSMAAEIAVALEISRRFPENSEIQLERAKAATNAIGRYGAARLWVEMAEQLLISQEIASSFPSHEEIQYVRAQAATNAISDYGETQQWALMKSELAVSQSISERFPRQLSIRLARAQAATNAVNAYGASRQWREMAEEVAASHLIAEEFPENVDFQLERAKAACNAVGRYGAAEKWVLMLAELSGVEAISRKFSSHMEIQLQFAKAAMNAVNRYGAAGKFELMAGPLASIEHLAANFPGDIEIQLRLARSLFAKVICMQAAGLPADDALAVLYAHFECYPQLSRMPPFDQLLNEKDGALR